MVRPGTLAVLLLLASGCAKWEAPLTRVTRPAATAPAATTPAGAVRLLEWCWNAREADACRAILPGDFAFVAAAGDSAGLRFPGGAFTREDEMEATRHLFWEGTATEPPANHILLMLDASPTFEPDPRPGKHDPAVHRSVVTQLLLSVSTDDRDFNVTGAARLYLVRGDSALIPDDLLGTGVVPDANRWYVDRWEDETVGARPALAAQPARNITLFSILALYR